MSSGYKNNTEAVMYDKNGLPVYGMDAELALKQAAKYDPYKEAQVRDWIEAVTGENFASDDFQESLKDGVLLCKLVNKLKPGSVSKINGAKLPFMQMENINNFLNAIESGMGVKKSDSFRTVDLYEGKNVVSVIDSLFMLGSVAQKLVNYHGPVIGVKLAEKKEIKFSDEQLRQAKNQTTFMAEASLKGEFQKSIKNEVVKTTDSGDKTATSQQMAGSNKSEFQKSIKNEVVKVKDTGDKTSVAQQFQPASLKGDRQTSISKEVVKVKPASAPVAQQQQGSVDELAESLEKLASLRDKGILTDAEFNAKKKSLLGL